MAGARRWNAVRRNCAVGSANLLHLHSFQHLGWCNRQSGNKKLLPVLVTITHGSWRCRDRKPTSEPKNRRLMRLGDNELGNSRQADQRPQTPMHPLHALMPPKRRDLCASRYGCIALSHR